MGRTLSTSSLTEQDVLLLEALVDTLDLSCMEKGDHLEVYVEECGKEVRESSAIDYDSAVFTEVFSSEDEDDVQLARMIDLELVFEDHSTKAFSDITKQESNSRRRVRFSEEVEVFMIECANKGRKVSEISNVAGPQVHKGSQADADTDCLSVLRFQTDDGAVAVEVNDVAANYLRFIQDERLLGNFFLVKDFFLEAQEYDEGILPSQYHDCLEKPHNLKASGREQKSRRRKASGRIASDSENDYQHLIDHHEEFREKGRKRSHSNNKALSNNASNGSKSYKKARNPNSNVNVEVHQAKKSVRGSDSCNWNNSCETRSKKLQSSHQNRVRNGAGAIDLDGSYNDRDGRSEDLNRGRRNWNQNGNGRKTKNSWRKGLNAQQLSHNTATNTHRNRAAGARVSSRAFV